MPTKWTYRVRQIPAHIAHPYQLSHLLEKVLQYQQAITVHSLATDITSSEIPPTKVGTITFEDTPLVLESGPDSQWTFSEAKPSLQQNLIIDRHFHGFTVLNDVQPERHALE
jgi:hypothetical protein